MDKLISANKLKEDFRNYIESPSLQTLIDTIIDRANSIDPKCSGKWMRYDMIEAVLRAQARGLVMEGNTVGADAVTDMADYFEQLGEMIEP